ncbi:hypothetical protein, partial [Gemmiger formicilis]|uniref:hypothetical protein n=1 Tax=Gemmiger formicilis TaxID=745368 RepID=UPI0031F6417E
NVSDVMHPTGNCGQLRGAGIIPKGEKNFTGQRGNPSGVWHAFWTTEVIAAAISMVVYRKSVKLK